MTKYNQILRCKYTNVTILAVKCAYICSLGAIEKSKNTTFHIQNITVFSQTGHHYCLQLLNIRKLGAK